jgi:hypothetical protein
MLPGIALSLTPDAGHPDEQSRQWTRAGRRLRPEEAPVAFAPAQFIGTVLLFKWGWDASVLTAIMGKWMRGEPVNATRWFGIVLIIVASSSSPAR